MQERNPKTITKARSDRKVTLKSLPPIPDKRYFSIGEMGILCGVKPHVLRYWEQEFPQQLKPIKRRGNRRFYQHADVLAVRKISKLLYEEGFTIEGAKTQLMVNPETVTKTVQTDAVVKKLLVDLESVLEKLKEKVI